VNDDFDPLRELRPDRVRPDDPGDPRVLSREKERLMSTIDETRTSPSVVPMTPDIYPRLAYRDERAALEYLVRVFQFVENREARMEPGGEWAGSLLAWLHIGNGVVMIGRENADIHRIHSPLDPGVTTVQMMVNVHDVDAHYAHAVAEGADITMPLEDAFYGERRYEATDLEGHRWHFAESFDAIRARGGVVPDA
jgi:PhnB protein